MWLKKQLNLSIAYRNAPTGYDWTGHKRLKLSLDRTRAILSSSEILTFGASRPIGSVFGRWMEIFFQNYVSKCYYLTNWLCKCEREDTVRLFIYFFFRFSTNEFWTWLFIRIFEVDLHQIYKRMVFFLKRKLEWFWFWDLPVWRSWEALNWT